MTELTTPFPIPDLSLLALPPASLAGIAISSIRRVYGIELDFSLAGLSRLDALLSERFCRGQYRAETFPTTLALTIGVYLGEMLRRLIDGGEWGQPIDNLYGTPLPFLLYSHGEYARQINVVEDILTLLWNGQGAFAIDYFHRQYQHLRKLGFVAHDTPVQSCTK